MAVTEGLACAPDLLSARSSHLTLACTQGKRNPPIASGRLAVSAVDHDGVKWSQSNGPQVDPSTAKTGTDAAHPSGKSLQIEKADARTRTGDPFITSEVLYQLSYVGESPYCSRFRHEKRRRQAPKSTGGQVSGRLGEPDVRPHRNLGSDLILSLRPLEVARVYADDHVRMIACHSGDRHDVEAQGDPAADRGVAEVVRRESRHVFPGVQPCPISGLSQVACDVPVEERLAPPPWRR